MMTDEMIMKMVGEGNLNKMTILFEKYQLNLFNFFLKRGHHHSVSEDLTQNVFERVLKYRSTYNPVQPFRAWIFRIARNVEADNHRNIKIPINSLTEVNEVKFQTGNVLEKIEQQEQYSKLRKAIASLSKEEQELLHFSKFEQMKYGEIAEIMKISESAVKVKIHRAIKKLKKYYQKLEVL